MDIFKKNNILYFFNALAISKCLDRRFLLYTAIMYVCLRISRFAMRTVHRDIITPWAELRDRISVPFYK
jgi:hypothetical protein